MDQTSNEVEDGRVRLLRRLESASARIGAPYTVMSFVQSVYLGCIAPFLTIYLVVLLGYSERDAGTTIGTVIVANTLTSILIGFVVDRGNKVVLTMIGAAGALVSPLALLVPLDGTKLIVALICGAACSSLFSATVINRIYSENSPEAARSIYSKHYAAYNLGSTLGGVFVFIIGEENLRSVLFTSLALGASGALLVLFFFRPMKTPDLQQGQVRKWGRVKAIYLLSFFLLFSLSISILYAHYDTNIPLLIRSVRILDMPIYPLLAPLNGLFVALMQPVYGKLSRKYSPYTIVKLGSLSFFFGTAVLLIDFSSVLFVLLFVLIFSLGEALSIPAYMDVLNATAPQSERATWRSVTGIAYAGGGFSVATGAQIISSSGGAAYPVFLLALCLPLLLLSFAMQFVRSRNDLGTARY